LWHIGEDKYNGQATSLPSHYRKYAVTSLFKLTHRHPVDTLNAPRCRTVLPQETVVSYRFQSALLLQRNICISPIPRCRIATTERYLLLTLSPCLGLPYFNMNSQSVTTIGSWCIYITTSELLLYYYCYEHS